jgi:hypothetical protein
MNVGLGNLDTLKQHLLPSQTLLNETRFDTVIQHVGLGVAAGFERACNRKFARMTDATCTCSADRPHFHLDRTPVEDISKVELKEDEATGWVEQLSLVLTRDDRSGFVYWGGSLSTAHARIRFTFDGGYWFETLEPHEATYPSAMPATATALPDDLKYAWLLQCRQVWSTLDKLGSDILITGSSSQFVTGTLSSLDLVPAVKQILNGYIRYQLS